MPSRDAEGLRGQEHLCPTDLHSDIWLKPLASLNFYLEVGNIVSLTSPGVIERDEIIPIKCSDCLGKKK